MPAQTVAHTSLTVYLMSDRLIVPAFMPEAEVGAISFMEVDGYPDHSGSKPSHRHRRT